MVRYSDMLRSLRGEAPQPAAPGDPRRQSLVVPHPDRYPDRRRALARLGRGGEVVYLPPARMAAPSRHAARAESAAVVGEMAPPHLPAPVAVEATPVLAGLPTADPSLAATAPPVPADGSTPVPALEEFVPLGADISDAELDQLEADLERELQAELAAGFGEMQVEAPTTEAIEAAAAGAIKPEPATDFTELFAADQEGEGAAEADPETAVDLSDVGELLDEDGLDEDELDEDEQHRRSREARPEADRERAKRAPVVSEFTEDRQRELRRAQKVGAEVAARSRKRLENTLYWAQTLLAAQEGGIEQVDPTRERDPETKNQHAVNYKTIVKLVEVMFSMIKDDRKVRERTVRLIVDEILRNILQDRFLLTNLVNIKSEENYFVGHAVNVAILAANVACHLKLEPRRIREIITGGLFQGIGLLKLPETIIEKPGALSPTERLQLERHSIYAIGYLDKHLDVSKMVGLLISQCHERLDGSGYPKGRRANNLHPHSQIIAVCNVYDALTSRRPWRGPKSPYEAMEILLHMAAENKLDTSVVRAFLQCNSLFPVGSMVLLTNGQIGRVIAANTQEYTAPVVRLYERDTKQWGEVVNLAGVEDLKVKRCLSAEFMGEHDPLAGF